MKHFIFILFVLCSLQLSFGQSKFKHILITNDDGKEDSKKLFALATSVKDVADRVSIIVSEFDRSGTSNRTAYGKYQSTFEITCKYIDKENKITAYTTPDYPADCVLIGLGGFFGDDRPDLVLSGINGGPNIGPDWFGSGTIGAARMAAYLGVKAIAISGFEKSFEESFKITPGWITKLISSGFIDEMDKNSYLTIGIPKTPFEKIKGIKLAERQVAYNKPQNFKMVKLFGDEPGEVENTTVWTFKSAGDQGEIDKKLDESLLEEGYIIITPMSINENDDKLMQNLKRKKLQIPELKE